MSEDITLDELIDKLVDIRADHQDGNIPVLVLGPGSAWEITGVKCVTNKYKQRSVEIEVV